MGSNNVFTVTVDGETYALLRQLKRLKNNKPLRRIVMELIKTEYRRLHNREPLVEFCTVVTDVLEDTEGLIEYLSEPFIRDLFMLLEETRPTYKDILTMKAAIIFWNINPLQFFETMITYAKYGITEMGNDE